MEIKINNQSFLFKDTSDVQERKKIIEDFLQEEVKTATGNMTVEEYYTFTWDKPTTKTSLDRIGYYLSKMPEQNNKEDKMILSPSKELEMSDGYRKTSKAANKLTPKEIEELELTQDEIKNNPKKRYTVYVKSSAVHYDDMSLEEKISTGLTEIEETD